MAPTKAKVTKTKGAAVPVPHAKRTNKAGSQKFAPAVTVQGQYQRDDEEMAVTTQDDDYQKLDALMSTVTDLSR